LAILLPTDFIALPTLLTTDLTPFATIETPLLITSPTTFPAGTLSGAPKIRAMEIIDQVEPVKRGIFGGAVGYLGWHGEMDMSIAIRTCVIRDQKVYVQAGAGLVADSNPESEWNETQIKARAVIKAVELSSNGLIL
jgi:anthranilate synthase component 1